MLVTYVRWISAETATTERVARRYGTRSEATRVLQLSGLPRGGARSWLKKRTGRQSATHTTILTIMLKIRHNNSIGYRRSRGSLGRIVITVMRCRLPRQGRDPHPHAAR